MGLTRREAILASLSALALGGCSSASRRQAGHRPVPNWPGHTASPSRTRVYTPVQAPAQPRTAITPNRTNAAAPVTGLAAISRSQWTRTSTARSKVNAMNGISKLTIHHDGMDPSYITGKTAVAERIEKIRNYHTQEKGWGDIGYHYIVDRAGRVWQGRPLQYQGAHVRNNNENNIGILVMGNFDKQSPSDAQLKALFSAAETLTQQYSIKTAKVRSHQEINKTACPGRNLQKQMNALRRHLA